MTQEKRCIVHLPYKPDLSGRPSASQLRPIKMIDGFKSIGYSVVPIIGNSNDRRIRIAQVKESIEAGVRYDFIYSESSTIPTSLTDEDHLPRWFDQDFRFFRFCRKHGIPIGLFYRDAYWAAGLNKQRYGSFKSALMRVLYHHDLREYEKNLDVLFCPSKEFIAYFSKLIHGMKALPLPPGCDSRDDCQNLNRTRRNTSGPLEVLYVGGIDYEGNYDLTLVLKVASSLPQVNLTICVREDDWEKVAQIYRPLISSNIRVVHESGNALFALYDKADVAILCFKQTCYRWFSMPYKLFEYVQYGLPIIVSDGTAASDWVKECGCGWPVEYSFGSIKELMVDLANKPNEVAAAGRNAIDRAHLCTWGNRANDVVDALFQVDRRRGVDQ